MVPRVGVYRELRLSSPAIVYVEAGLDETVSPMSDLVTLAGEVGETVVASVMVNELSLRLRLVLALDLELSPSLNKLEESAVDTDAAGDPGRRLGLASR